MHNKLILPIGVSMENIVMVFSSPRGFIEWPEAYHKACRVSLCPQCYMVVQHTPIKLPAHHPNVPIWQYFELNSILIKGPDNDHSPIHTAASRLESRTDILSHHLCESYRGWNGETVSFGFWSASVGAEQQQRRDNICEFTVWLPNRSFTHQIEHKCLTLKPTRHRFKSNELVGSVSSILWAVSYRLFVTLLPKKQHLSQVARAVEWRRLCDTI